ncbi:MAG: M28 family peptidase [Verrucomicrobiaceae bacterium]|nr:M28 family peptidase [Verrucomicrobiaceae bacterium]
MKDTKALALPEGRRVGQPGHGVARKYLLDRFSGIGLEPFFGDDFELPFSGEGQSFFNLAARIPGNNPELDPVLIGAHYDSVIDAPCADDNATAVAVVLAAAEHFKRHPQERDLVVVLFDSEEPPFFQTPLMGSTRFYEDHCRGIRFACVLIMDLIGHDVELKHDAARFMPTLKRLVFVLGSESDESLPGVVEWAGAQARGLKVFPTLNRYIGDLSDHHAFRLGGQPFLFLSCGQGKHYHLPSDDIEWINFDKVKHVFALVVDLVRCLDSTEMLGEQSDPAEFEIRMIRKLIGPVFPLFLKMLGLRKLTDRSDLDALAAMMSRELG